MKYSSFWTCQVSSFCLEQILKLHFSFCKGILLHLAVKSRRPRDSQRDSWKIKFCYWSSATGKRGTKGAFLSQRHSARGRPSRASGELGCGQRMMWGEGQHPSEDASASLFFTPGLAPLAVAAGLEHVTLSEGGVRTDMCQGGGERPSSVGPGACVPQPLPTSQNPNLLQPFWGAGGRGSNTLAGTELPPSCYRPRSSRSSYQNSEAWGCVEMVCSTVGECVRSPAGPMNDCIRVTVLRKRQRPWDVETTSGEGGKHSWCQRQVWDWNV